MQVFVIILLIVSVGMPLAYAWRVARLDEASRIGWLIAVANAGVVLALVFLLGRWDIAGYFTRFLLMGIFLLAAVLSLRKHVSRPWRAAGKSALAGRRGLLVSLVLCGLALVYVVSGILPPANPKELVFPLEGGRFMVGQGGGVKLLNHHAGHPEQRHAADITAIGPLGFRAAGILPKQLGRYAIFGASVVSPCDGAVIAVRDGLPDLVPPERDPDNPAGNHAIIDCGGFNVELAHLGKDSLEVKAGDRIDAGDAVGAVGNSGNTTEPHLHIHAVDPDKGVGLPVAFRGRAPVRNRLYVR